MGTPRKGSKAARYAALKKVKIRLGHPSFKPRLGGWRVGMAAAVLLLLMTVGGIWLFDRPAEVILPLDRAVAIRTKTDSTLHRVLPDDSQVWLNGNSSVVYSEGENGTIYANLSGEAMFEVESRPGSTFSVSYCFG